MVDLPPRPPDDVERLLTAELDVVGRFGDASNATLLIHLGTAEHPSPPEDFSGDLRTLEAGRWAVHKPRDGEAPLWDFPDGTLYRREVAAYEIDRALGWGMVPTTVVREDGPWGPGSVQALVPHDPTLHFFRLVEEAPTPAVLRQLERMVLFDTIIENADRKGGHVLCDDRQRLWLVDHGVCFHPEPHLRTVAWHLAGQAVNEDDRADAGRLAQALVPGGELDERLITLLSTDERAVLRRRARAAADRPQHVHPVGPRPMPWPLV